MGEKVTENHLKTFLGTLLVGGTALGAGMLALPLATAGAGLWPSWLVYFLCWIFSICTGLLFVEIGLSMPKDANIASMATAVFGVWGTRIAWVLYLFLFYLLTIAYVNGGGQLVSLVFGNGQPMWLPTLVFTAFFGTFVYLGTRISGRANAMLMIGLVITYAAFLILGIPHINFSFYEHVNWKSAFFGLPVIFTSFSYQGIIPSLLTYLDRDPKKMKIAIICGTAIPFVAYLAWDLIIKGIVPIEGKYGLLTAQAMGMTAVDPLYHFLAENSALYVVGKAFAFFALTTSFIGVTLGLRDFLADSLHIKKNPMTNLALCLIIYLPAIFLTLINPKIFLTALGLAGGFGCALLLGLLPTAMAWSRRADQVEGQGSDCMLPGGRFVLAILALFVFFEVGLEILSELSAHGYI